MGHPNTSIILIRLLSDKTKYKITSEIQTKLEANFGQLATVYSMDNFSDRITTHYAGELLDHSDKILIVCESAPNAPLGSAQSVLNKATKLRHKITLYSFDAVKALTPFLKFLKGRVISDLAELEIH